MEEQSEFERLRALHRAATNDHLTGLFNRRHFEARLASEFAYCTRHGAALALLAIDLDFFKRVNDTYGHPAGDAVLAAVGKLLTVETRAEDVAARLGGEEFVVLARGTGQVGALVLANRLLIKVRALRIPFDTAEIAVSFSVGLAALDCMVRPSSPAHFLLAADQALLAAKQSGRNCVRCWAPRAI